MGCEIGQSAEWNENGQLDWWLLDAGPYHRGLQKFVEDLNKLYTGASGLWQGDYDHAGFYWIDCTTAKAACFRSRDKIPTAQIRSSLF